MAFGVLEVHAGDFKKGNDHQYVAGKPGTLIMKIDGKFFREKIPVSEIQELEPASEETVKRIGGAVGWGVVGGVLLGPVGLLALTLIHNSLLLLSNRGKVQQFSLSSEGSKALPPLFSRGGLGWGLLFGL